MLKDSEIVDINKSDDYKNIIEHRLKSIVADIRASGHGELNPEMSTGIKILQRVFLKRIIRYELYKSSKDLLERILNSDLQWPRTPSEVKNICAGDGNYLWMRYDETRVEVLITRCINLITDAKLRNLLKIKSSLEETAKNERLKEIKRELESLKEETILSIISKGIFDGVIGLRNKVFYENNKDKIQDKIINSQNGGTLGFLPKDNEGDNND